MNVIKTKLGVITFTIFVVVTLSYLERVSRNVNEEWHHVDKENSRNIGKICLHFMYIFCESHIIVFITFSEHHRAYNIGNCAAEEIVEVKGHAISFAYFPAEGAAFIQNAVLYYPFAHAKVFQRREGKTSVLLP